MSKENKSIERISFLAEKYNVFTLEEAEVMLSDDSTESFSDVSSVNELGHSILLALFTVKYYKDGRIKVDDANNPVVRKIYISEDVFIQIVQSDVTINKVTVQWMLDVFSRLIKSGRLDLAKRFIEEDLPQAKEYLTIFEGNKFKKSFKELCQTNNLLSDVSDPSNINQYNGLSQLFDAVDPFIEKDVSQLELGMLGFVKRKAAKIPYRDRNFIVYCPLRKEASTLFDNFATWCTAKIGQTNFTSYRNDLTPYGNKSDLYIIVDTHFLLDDDDPNRNPDGLWQIHFESGQMMNRSNRGESDIYKKVICKSEGLDKFFYDLLLDYAKADSNIGNVSSSVYGRALSKFGYNEILFDLLVDDSGEISFIKKKIRKLPDLSRFKSLRVLYLNDSGLKVIHPSISKLPSLTILSLPNNELTEIPTSICYLKTVESINLFGNKITSVPDELKNLDTSCGGSLVRLVFGDGDISDENLEKVKSLLPNTNVVELEKIKK